MLPYKLLQKKTDYNRCYWINLDKKKAINLVLIKFYGLVRAYLDVQLVEAAGIEPASASPLQTVLHT